MKKITLLLFAFFTCWQINAQVSSYSFSETTETYAQITGTTSTATGDDGTQTNIPIGFVFNYGGVNYTAFGITTNGMIRLGSNATDTAIASGWTNTLSNTSANRPLIAAFWDDNNLSTGTIIYSLTGTAPNQVLTVNWHNTKIGSSGGTGGASVSTLIRLYETTNIIEIVYSSPFTTTNSVSASVGLNDATSFLSVTPAATSTVSSATANNGINATVMANLAGKKLIFTPPVPCSGVPTAGSVTPAIQNICSGTVPGTLVATGFTGGVTGLSFQWEESNDDGVTDVWQNAVGGTGATTSSYIPPAFSGTTIYYRLKVTCTNSGSSSETASVSINPPATPSNQVTLLTAGTVTLTTIPLSWTNGNGNRRVVYFSNSPVFVDPVNGNGPALTANTVYAGSGQQIVFDGTGTTVTVTGLTQGTTYYAKVYEYTRCGAGPYDYYYNVTTGTNIITVATQSAPANDNFANAAVISCGNTYTGSTVYASLDEDSAPDGFGADMDAPNVWFSFTGSGTAQTVTLDLCASSYDSSVLIYTGTSGALTLIGGNDDDASCTNGTRSKASFNSDGTTTYYIAIEGWNSGSTGAYSMTVSCVAVNPPAVTNQDCGTSLAVNVDGVNVGSDNSYGTVNATQPSCDSFGSIQDVWFSFQAPTSGLVDCAVTVGSMTSGNFTVYSGTCATLTETTLACNSNFTGTITENLTGLVAGNTYYVQVWSNASEQGTFIINLSDPSLSSSSFDNNAFRAYPNPVKDILNLSYTSEISNVQVVNMLGQVVLDKKMNATEGQINLSGFNSGAYIVNVTVGNITKSIKVIKQ